MVSRPSSATWSYALGETATAWRLAGSPRWPPGRPSEKPRLLLIDPACGSTRRITLGADKA
jgi:hypothetical protein